MPGMTDTYWLEWLEEFRKKLEILEASESSHNVDVDSSTKSDESLNIETL